MNQDCSAFTFSHLATTAAASMTFGPAAGITMSIVTSAQAAMIFQPTALTELRIIAQADPTTTPFYQNRPIYDLDMNWDREPKKSFDYELNDKLIGFSSPRFEQVQTATVQGIEFDLILENEIKIGEFDSFTDLLYGRLNGFWMPSPFETLEITDVLSATIFKIKEQGLRNYFADHPSSHLIFKKSGSTTQYGKIASVVSSGLGSGKETVTLDAGLAVSIDATWGVSKLLYVRMVSDSEEAIFAADNYQTRKIKVIELPNEYTTIEIGERPVFLYEFSIVPTNRTPYYWRFTSLNEDIIAGGYTWTSKPIEHGNRILSMKAQKADVKLTTWYEPDNPVAKFIPFSLPFPLWLRIYETDWLMPTADRVIFFGQVASPEAEGKLLTASCISFIDSMGSRWPKFFIQPFCGYFLYDEGTCKLSRNNHRARVTLQNADDSPGAIVGQQVKVEISGTQSPDVFTGAIFNSFSLGYIETGDGITYEISGIRQSSAESGGTMILRLTQPLLNAVVDQEAYIFEGCDGSPQRCKQFNNFRNFGGHVVPLKNPSVVAVTANKSQNKK